MPSRWRTVDLGEPAATLPAFPACYAFYGDGRLVYVGSTANLLERCLRGGHSIRFARYSADIVTPWGRFRNVHLKYRPSRRYGDWAMIELRLLRRLRPPGNRRCPQVGAADG